MPPKTVIVKRILPALFGIWFLFCASEPALACDTDVHPADQTGISAFVSLWTLNRADVWIKYRNGRYYAWVSVREDEENWTEWYYDCLYDNNIRSLICKKGGVKTVCIYDDDKDAVAESVTYTDGSAVFSINDSGQLIWIANNERFACPFSRMGNFEGLWKSGGTVIAFDAYDGFYRCLISRAADGDSREEWRCFCLYDGETDSAVCRDQVSKYIIHGRIIDDEINEPEYDGEITSADIYDDGTSVFFIDGSGRLIWQDSKENAGAGLLFEKAGTDDAFFESMHVHLAVPDK